MARTDRFRRQHQEILQLMAQITSMLDTSQPGEKARDIRTQLSVLAGKLNVHLAMEDNALYPSLLEQKDGNVGLVARKYAEEMGHIKETFAGYLKKWPTPMAIQNDPGRFSGETREIFAALARRIQREDDELYPLVDRLG